MSFKDSYDFDRLANAAEQLVVSELEKQTAERGDALCGCEECVLDMAAMALNSVKPLYRVSLLGTLYAAHAMEEESYAASVRAAVSAAIDKVGANPSHD